MFYTSILSSDQISQELKQIASQYPQISQLRLEGHSEDGRPVYSMTIGKGQKALICTAGVHGRESINPTVLVEMTKTYCENFTNPMRHSSWEMLQQYRILFLPLLNPDGYEIALHGFGVIQTLELRRRPSDSDREWKYNARGADINRNFPCQSYRRQHEDDMPFSEAESRILADIFQREESVGYIDFHSRGREIFWYRAALDKAYNDRQRKLAEALEKVCHYRIGTPQDEMQDIFSGGNTVQYYSEQYHLPAITIETVPEEGTFPLSPKWLGITYEEIREIPLCYLSCLL